MNIARRPLFACTVARAFYIALLVCLAGAQSPPSVRANGEVKGGARRFALLVGVTEYDSKELPDLLYPDADVEALADVLFKKGYQQSDVVVLNSTRGKADAKLRPSAEVIDTQLKALLKKAGPNDLILVALSGHGYQPRKGTAFFCAHQAQPAANKGMVSVEAVVKALSASGAGMNMLLVDACRDSPGQRAAPREFSEGFDTTATARGEGVVVFYSCAQGERSWEFDSLKHGAFFDLLIKGLDGKADDYPDGKVTWTELVGYVRREINFYAQQYKRKQTPHVKGDNPRDIALVEFAVNAAPVPEVPLNANEVLREDFASIKDGLLPRGWEGDGFEKKFDEKKKRHCIELRKPDGVHWLTPAFSKPLTGDFIVEMEFKLHGTRYSPNQFKSQDLLLCFQGEDGYVLPVKIDPEGLVHFPESTTRTTKHFKPNEINRMRLIREGNSYNVSLNDGDAASTSISYQGGFESIRIGIVGGKLPDLCRFYSIKAASIETKPVALVPSPPPPQFGKTVLSESFSRQNLGAVLPKGWTGEGFSLTTDERYQRRCLEVNKPNPQVYWLTLPALDKSITGGGDFYVEFECLLLGYGTANLPHLNHQVHFRLEGARAKPFHALVDYLGNLYVDGHQPKKFSSFAPYAPNRFRIIQKNGVFRFLCNDFPLTDVAADRFPYDTLRIGLTGTDNYGFGGNLAARLYDVKVVSLPGRCEKLAKFTGNYEDFRTTLEGKAPPGWTATDLGGYAPILNRFLQPARLVFPTDETPGGGLESPPIKLSGSFQVECEFEFLAYSRQEFGGLHLGLFGAKSPLLVARMGKGVGKGFDRDFFIFVDGAGATKITSILKKSGEVNSLTIDRKESSSRARDKKGKETGPEIRRALYTLTLNGQRVGVVPSTKGTGPLERIRLQALNPTKGRFTSQLRKIVASGDSDANP